MHIQKYLDLEGLSKRAFAKKAELSHVTIMNACKGIRIRRLSAVKISNASNFKVTIDDLEVY